MGAKFDFKTLGQPLEADWPVHVKVPVDGGKVEVRTFMARFRELTDEEKDKEKAASEAAEAALKADPSAKPERIDPKDRLRRTFIGLGAGEDETLTDDLKEALLKEDRVYIALLTAWANFLNGVVEKNS